MTEPTQAQIEALRKAQVLSWDGTWITGSTKKVVAALTAAAEVGWKCKAQRTADPPQDCDWPVCGCDPYADKVIAALQESSLTAAAEADEFPPDSLEGAYRQGQKLGCAAAEAHDAQVDRYVTLGNAMKMQTIERCAQVAENFPSTGSRSIAAAIRALKD